MKNRLANFIGSLINWDIRSLVGDVGIFLTPKTGMNAKRSKFEDLKYLTPTNSPVIIDGGAHNGESIEKFIDIFDEPTVHAVEANPKKASMLRCKYSPNPNIHIYNVALGPNEDTKVINISKDDISSSLLSPTTENVYTFGENVDTHSRKNIKQIPLDSLINPPVDIIKLDLQGYELPALHGADRHLDNCSLVLSETAFRQMYHGQELFCELSQYVGNKGFEIFNLYDIYTSSSGKITEADVIFTKPKPTSN